MKKVLILGKNGMTGQMLYSYLSKNNNIQVAGTTRSGKSKFSPENIEKDLEKIFYNFGKFDYLINCIAINNVTMFSSSEVIQTNSLLPITLGTLSTKHKYKFIHISTDAVFKPKSGKVTEKSIPETYDLYSMTKLLGESTNINTLNIRTSIIGSSPNKKSGFIEFIKSRKNKTIYGFINQIWSGCTSLQFAKLCEYIVIENKFDSLRKKSGVFHFAPLGPVSKYDLISIFSKESKINLKLSIVKSPNEITRYLDSIYLDNKFLNKFDRNLNQVLKELIEFEKVDK